MMFMRRADILKSPLFKALYEEGVRLPTTPRGAEDYALDAMEDRLRDKVWGTVMGDPYDAELPGLIVELQIFQIARTR